MMLCYFWGGSAGQLTLMAAKLACSTAEAVQYRLMGGVGWNGDVSIGWMRIDE
jgi:hypothetical protein